MVARVIAVVGVKGGVSKTTLSVHLAGLLAERGRRVAVLDADPQQSASRWLLEAAPDMHVERASTPDDILEGLPALAAEHEVVVADGPAGDGEATRALLLRADLAVLPVGPSALDLRAVSDTARLVVQARSVRGGLPAALLVMSRVTRTRAGNELRDALAGLGLPIAAAAVPARSAIADAPGQGTLVWRMGAAAAEAAAELRAVLELVLSA